MGQKDGEKWTAAVNLEPTISKSDRHPRMRFCHVLIEPPLGHSFFQALMARHKLLGTRGVNESLLLAHKLNRKPATGGA
jgi:hypothetical protein